jgi:hypothetical protein
VVKYFTARWSLERVVKCYFAARQSRENRHVKKKRGRQVQFPHVWHDWLLEVDGVK